MPSKDPVIKKAYKDGVITKGQYEKLSDGLLKGIIAKKKKGGTKKGEVRKTARKAYEPKKNGTKAGGCPCPNGKKKNGGVKEERKKVGKEKHKRGRPKGGSKVEIVK